MTSNAPPSRRSVDRRLLDFEGRPILVGGTEAARLLADLVQRGGKITTTAASVDAEALRKLVMARLATTVTVPPNLITYQVTELGQIAVRDLLS